ncbi:golgin subfamily A member 3 isoform X2 [Takifugu rubripes]|uniref:golgin subfamily A member 3 isoform X2 n=1 Tax=Takifugu rubripes TaxID=31033 RepID=UPI0011458E1A|nr:golgin subfamily A member 3 isoform X2 [Takifugu rubripes]
MDAGDSQAAQMANKANQEAHVTKSKEGHSLESVKYNKEQELECPSNTGNIQNGPVSSEAMPNANGLVGGFEAQLNGSVSPSALPQSTSSPVNSQNQQSSPANSKPSLEMENEEKIRLEARRRLEEQLKQYRVQRHKERSHRSTPKNRPFSTLDPELMMHPEALPRANTVAMTTEYSFLRTSVPRGPKLGSLGIPATKEKKSRSSRSNKIHSLADYKSPEEDGGVGGGGGGTPDNTVSSLQTSISSVSTEVSVVSESSTCETGQPGISLQGGDNVSELDGSESGMRVGNDGNDSDSSSYSSVSTRGTYGRLAAAVERQQGPYTVEGREIAPEAMGHFPSLQEVLQAAREEQHLLELEQEREGTAEPRSRRDSFSSSASLESSVMGHDEMLQVLKEKMRLEGQLESLSSEATQALKEKTELQAQLAAVNAQLQAKTEEAQFNQQKQSTLNVEVGTLRQNCSQLEKAMMELQGNLESKNASLVSLGNDLKVAEDQYSRLMVKVEEMQNTVASRDSTVQDLRQQMGGLQSQLQQVQLERSTLQSRLKTSQAEIDSLQQLRQWYQQQLALAQEARVRLQSEMASMQAGQMTQIGVVEHLKLENVTLSHQLTETQHRSIKDKERIAVQLQSIEADMLTQEANYKQIHDAKTMVEDDLQHKLEEFEEERERLLKLANTASTLERELEQVNLVLSQKDGQLQLLQKEHLELMRQLTTTQENLHTKEQAINQLEARYLELEAQLSELQTENNAKDDNIQYLQNEKIVLEVALQAARVDKSQLDENAERLGEDVLVASDVLDQLRQEVHVKANQIKTLQQENSSLKKQCQKVKEQFQQQKIMVEAYRRDASSKDQLISELKSTKKRLLSEVKDLKQDLLGVQEEKQKVELEQTRLQKEVLRVQEQMSSMEAHLQAIQTERDQLETQIQSLQFDQNQLTAVTEENENLRKQVEQMEGETKKAISEQKVRMKRLGTDLTSAQKDMKAKHKAYENAVSILSRRLQEALTDKEAAEAELAKLKAQVLDGGNSQALQEKITALQAELQVVTNSKAMLEKELQEVITLTSTELEEYQEKVLELEDELQESRCFKKRIRKLEDANKKLALELEHEKGKLAGVTQSHNALRDHSNILESALAKREADLVQLNLQVQAVLKRKEEEDQQMKQVVQTLQLALEKEKTKVKDLKEQLAAAKAEAAHNRRHYRAAMLELSEVKKDLQAKEDLINVLQSESQKLQSQGEQHAHEVSRFQEELAEAHSQLHILQKQLDEEIAKRPLTNQEIEDLKWELEQRQREIDAQKQQQEMVEQCHVKELDNLQRALQNIKVELESVQEELTNTRKDKFMLQVKVSELRNSMKTVLLQNQQLKLDLKQNRLRKQRMELKGEGNPSNPVTPVKIPDCPVPASLLDELLKPSTSVNKEPLNNLHNCLRQLKEEMDSLQRQMEEHTVTVHESMSSWQNTEEDPAPHGLPDNTSTSSAPLNNRVLENNNEAEQQQL